MSILANPRWKRARKIHPLVFLSSRRRCIRKFHYVVEQRTSKKCTENNVLPFYMCRFVVLLRAIFVWPWNENAQTKQKQQMNEYRTIWLFYRTDTNARGFWLVKRTLGWFFSPFSPNAEPGPRLDVFVALAVGPASFRTLLDVRYKSSKVKFLDSRWLWMNMGSIYCFLGY